MHDSIPKRRMESESEQSYKSHFTSKFGEIGINVQWVIVSTEPVEGCLLGEGLLL